MERIPLDDIITDGMQVRAEMRQEIVEEYAALYEEGAKFPPVRVMRDGLGRNWLVDGFHRVAAARRLGKVRIRAEVEPGSRTEAQWAACGANSSHGLAMSNEDKRKAVTFALKLHPEMSDADIARHVGATRRMVLKYRNSGALPPMPVPPGEVAGVDGQHVNGSHVAPAGNAPSHVNGSHVAPGENAPRLVNRSPVATPENAPSLVNNSQPEPLPLARVRARAWEKCDVFVTLSASPREEKRRDYVRE